MPNDQGERYNEDIRRSAMIGEFLEHHFTKEQILANFAVLHREAENLLFHSTPFQLVPTSAVLDEMDKSSFEQCLSENSAPVAAGVDLAEKARLAAIEACAQKTGYRPRN